MDNNDSNRKIVKQILRISYFGKFQNIDHFPKIIDAKIIKDKSFVTIPFYARINILEHSIKQYLRNLLESIILMNYLNYMKGDIKEDDFI